MAKMQLVRSLSTPSCSFASSLCSTNLLTFTKKSHASACAKCSRSCVRVLETQRGKHRVRSLSNLSSSFTASLRSNLPLFIKKSSKHTNCLLSRSCLLFADVAIIGPFLLTCTHTSTREHTSASTSACIEGSFCTHMRYPGPRKLLPCYSCVFVKLPVSSTVATDYTMHPPKAYNYKVCINHLHLDLTSQSH